uniref:Uncharacterized protein n=1 Tax=Oryza punctata TaxID=4537 RepID=A0A0E0JW42_ORYPU
MGHRLGKKKTFPRETTHNVTRPIYGPCTERLHHGSNRNLRPTKPTTPRPPPPPPRLPRADSSSPPRVLLTEGDRVSLLLLPLSLSPPPPRARREEEVGGAALRRRERSPTPLLPPAREIRGLWLWTDKI